MSNQLAEMWLRAEVRVKDATACLINLPVGLREAKCSVHTNLVGDHNPPFHGLSTRGPHRAARVEYR